MLCFSVLNLLFGGWLNIFCTIIAGMWVITVVLPKTGEVFSKFVRTSQSRDELMKRNASALTKQTGKETKSQKVRNGFWNWNDDAVVNGKRIKGGDIDDYTDIGEDY